MCFAADVAYGNPTAPTVINGQVTFARTNGVLSIANSPGSIINWQRFSIGAGESTRFIQQSAASAVLNRVVGIDPSSILGSLQSNGRVFLINPNGILFGAGARVDTAGLVASTLGLSNEDFLAGRLRFAGDPAKAAAVVNQGRIAASGGGSVFLVGAAVDNQGVITAPSGDIVLAAGNSVRVTEGAGSRLQVEISAPADSAINLSEALYGTRGIYGGLVKNSGVISADTALQTADGRIILKASKDVTLERSSRVTANGAQGGSITAQAEQGTLLVDGTLEAKGIDAKGGTVQLLGERVGLIGEAKIGASGRTGGGTVLVGGDYQGNNPAVQNATFTFVGEGVSINADAVATGNGGKVIVWANDTTRFYGEISARGGAARGNGGFVETSGKALLDARGAVNASATHGAPGQWLLDPNNITIQSGGGNTNVTASPNFTSTNDNAIVTTGSIQTALNSGTSVTVTTASAGTNSQLGDITVADPIAKTAGGAATLTLTALNDITFSGGGTRGDITSTTGALNLVLNATGAINSLQNVSLLGGTLTLNAAGNVTQSGTIQGTTSVVKNGAGTFTLSQANTYTGSTTINAGTATLGNNNPLAGASSVVINGGTFNIANRSETVAGVHLLSGAITGTTGILTSSAAFDMQSGTVSAILGGTAGLTKTTGGTVTLSGANTYTGATTVSAGTLALGASNVLANASTVAVNGGTLSIGANSDTVAGVQLTGGSITGSGGTLTSTTAFDMQAGSVSAILGGAAGLNKTTAGTVTLSGANTYTGATTVNAGTLALGASNVLANASTVVVNGGTLDIGANSDTVAGVQLTGGSITGSGGTLTSTTAFDMQAGSASAILGGDVGLNKSTTGTVTLSGANTYTGATTVRCRNACARGKQRAAKRLECDRQSRNFIDRRQ